MSNPNPLDRVVLVHLHVRIWSGTAKLHRESDLKAIESQLPPTELVSDGVKRLLNVSELNPLENHRKNAERELRRLGTPFLDCVAIPDSKLAICETKLDELRTGFQTDRAEILQKLPEHYADWDKQHPTWAQILANARPNAQEVERRCQFSWTVFRPTSVIGAMCDLSDEAQRFVPELLLDIADQAENLWEKSFKGRDIVRQSAVKPVLALVEKLDSFGFLDPRVSPAVTAFRSVLSGLPKQGPLGQGQTLTVAGLVLQMADPERILDHGTAVFQNLQVHKSEQSGLFDDDAIDDEVAAPAPVAIARPRLEPQFASVPIAVGF